MGHYIHFVCLNIRACIGIYVVIPVPDHFVPDAMVEWGQVPNTLEVLTSEIMAHNIEENSIEITRCEIQVMPEVGCGLDNLDTIIKRSSSLVPDGNYLSFDDGSLVYMEVNNSRVSNDNEPSIQLVFILNDDNNCDVDEEDECRLRVTLHILPASRKIAAKSPSVIRERKINSVSTDGDIAKGGGLDARTVSRLIGLNGRPVFVDEPTPDISTEKCTALANDDAALLLPSRLYISVTNSSDDRYCQVDVGYNDRRRRIRFQVDELGAFHGCLEHFKDD